MQGKEKIIDDILSAARKTAAAMIDEATAERDAAVDALRAELEKSAAQAAEKTRAAADAVYAGQVKLGELESGKLMLKAKQDCVAAVYAAVREKILAQSDAQYLALLQKLIVRYCEDGDEVVAAGADAKRVTAAWVKKVSTAAKKKLTLSAARGDFAGGVILRNARYDRDLTVDELIADLKDRTESEVAKKLGLCQ